MMVYFSWNPRGSWWWLGFEVLHEETKPLRPSLGSFGSMQDDTGQSIHTCAWGGRWTFSDIEITESFIYPDSTHNNAEYCEEVTLRIALAPWYYQLVFSVADFYAGEQRFESLSRLCPLSCCTAVKHGHWLVTWGGISMPLFLRSFSRSWSIARIALCQASNYLLKLHRSLLRQHRPYRHVTRFLEVGSVSRVVPIEDKP